MAWADRLTLPCEGDPDGAAPPLRSRRRGRYRPRRRPRRCLCGARPSPGPPHSRAHVPEGRLGIGESLDKAGRPRSRGRLRPCSPCHPSGGMSRLTDPRGSDDGVLRSGGFFPAGRKRPPEPPAADARRGWAVRPGTSCSGPAPPGGPTKTRTQRLTAAVLPGPRPLLSGRSLRQPGPEASPRRCCPRGPPGPPPCPGLVSLQQQPQHDNRQSRPDSPSRGRERALRR